MNKTPNDINKFFEELNASNTLIRKMLVFSGYKSEEARRKEENEVCSEYKDKYGYLYSATKITKDIFIITVYDGEDIKGYMPHVLGENNKFNGIYDSIDKAIIASMSLKYGRTENAANYIFRMINM